MRTTNNSDSKNFFVKAAFTLWFAFFSTASFASNFYWVGGTGNWSDYGTHWATSSGGVIFHTTIPSLNDNVYFDGNSFPSANDTVNVNAALIYCNSMNWTGVTNQPVIKGGPLKIYGSLTLSAGVVFKIGLRFASTTTGNTITCNGDTIRSSMNFEGINGGWSLTDALSCTSGIALNNGSFITNSQTITCQSFGAYNNYADLGSSSIFCNGNWNCTLQTLIAASSFISCTGTFGAGSNKTYGDITCQELDGNNNTFHDVVGLGMLWGNYNIIHNAVFTGSNSVIDGHGNFIHKTTFNYGFAMTGGNTFDTLIFNNPGYTVSLTDTLRVNDALWNNPQAGFPTTIGGGYISCPAGDTVCLEYLYLSSCHTTGGGVFYAGNYSVDLGNNSGWIWSACTPDTSNVWPGDANYDLTANNVDVLYVGLSYGYTGTTRAGASNAWVAQPSIDWLQQFANGANLKNADCNGDGTIDNNDTTAISLNYGQTHPFKAAPPQPSTNNTGIPFYLVANLDSAGLNFIVNLDMSLGNSSLQINNLYGLAFTLNFDTGYIDTNNVSFDFSNSMMGTPGVDLMTFTKSFASQGYIDVAMARTDHNNISGFGHLAQCGIVIVDNVAGISTVSFTITNITAFDKNEFPVTLTAYDDSIVVDTNLIASTHQIDLTQFVSVYPNPAKDILKINGGILSIQSVELISIMGGKIYSKKVDAHTTSISTQNIKDGLYVLRCQTNKGIVNRRVQILK